jgi:excisionase family DNA binding protein
MSEALLLRPAEAAELMSMSLSRVYQLAQTGELPGVVRLDGSVRIHRPTLEQWLAEQASGNTNTKRTAPGRNGAAQEDRDGPSTPHLRAS